jgi:hypothetical protein
MKTEKQNLETLAVKYNLATDFVNDLWDKVVDKANFERALRMFVAGSITYEAATGKEPINVGEIRHKVATDLWEFRRDAKRKVMEAMEQQRKIVEYYNGCQALKFPRKPKDGTQDVVFIKDGHLVAFARFEPKQGGIYAANNEVMPNFKWNPHQWLGRLRQINKAFYREVKKAAFADPRELFNFDV